jgi:hypothetical protein
MNPKDLDYITKLQKKDFRNRYSLYSGSRYDDIKNQTISEIWAKKND